VVALAASKSSLGVPFQEWVGLDGITAALQDPIVRAGLARSMWFTVLTTAGCVVVGTAVALLMHTTGRDSRVLRALVLLPMLTAPIAAGAVQSMLAFGVHPYFLASSLRGIIAQRLVRVLDPETRIPYSLEEGNHTFDEVREYLDKGEGNHFYGPNAHAPNEGYIGRTAIFEVLSVNRQIRDGIMKRLPSHQLNRIATGAGMIGFRRGAMLKVAQGVTTMEEVFKSVRIEYLELDEPL
jgi:hypothetical protein